MLTPEKNARLTQIGPGTPCGELLRRYWQPLCPVIELTEEAPKKRVHILSEQLLVYRGADGAYGCVAERCAHRGCSLYYGFIEGEAIRCPYHGWKYDRDGRILEQPFEPQASTFKDKVRQKAYPVQELAGLLFAYMGPAPAPLLPRWDVLVREDGTRKIQIRPLNCNWLQAQENTADTTHTYYLHGHMMEMRGQATPATKYYYRPIVKYDFSYCEWGIEKRCVYGGDYPEEEVRPPLIFPNILRIPEGTKENQHWRVPIDDTHTRIIVMSFQPAESGVTPPRQTVVPVEYLSSDMDKNGDFTVDSFASQDRMAWETQGEIFDRTAEHLGASDEGILMLRKLLDEQIAVVEKGEDPIALIRDPAKNRIIEFKSHSINRLETASASSTA
ncbi:MAG TPA: Rieske 2Fe-2S domain-containing protein [Candidatus Binatia bacterium]|nr:Rieske 2Fe-2S domain-containing protein [Candidatus Binatia bacterium]